MSNLFNEFLIIELKQYKHNTVNRFVSTFLISLSMMLLQGIILAMIEQQTKLHIPVSVNVSAYSCLFIDIIFFML